MALRKLETHTGPNGTAKLYRNAEFNEYVVKLSGNPDADYFTPDRDDATNTAILMVNHAVINDSKMQ